MDEGDGITRRLARWRAQSPFEEKGWWRRRWAVEGLDPADVPGLLALPDGDETSSETWWHNFEALYRRRQAPPVEPPAFDDSPEMARLFGVVEPVIAAVLDARLQRLHALPGVGVVPEDREVLAAILLGDLRERAVGMVSRTVVLELHVARVSGRLRAETPELRFAEFFDRLRDPDAVLRLFEEYPVLARQLLRRVELWLDHSTEVVERLAQDWPRIVEMFFDGEDPGPLTEGVVAAGDRHRGGRAVALLAFADGRRLVYKPRSLAVDERLADLLGELHSFGLEPRLRTARVLDRGDYGWMEWIAAAPCEDRAAVERFYRRQGAWLAILYALDAADFHYENLIAAGEHPVMIDLESVFQPRAEGLDLSQVDLMASLTLGDSVLRVGLLPDWAWPHGDSAGIEISGLGGRPGQLTAQPLPAWRGAGTDTMTLERRRLEMPGAQNQPHFDAGHGLERAKVHDFHDALRAGFVDTYRLLERRRDELLAGPVAAFAEVEVRVIVRPTQTYASLFQESFHPDFLRDAADRERHYDLLWRAVPLRAYFERLVRSEQRDLWREDVPLFTVQPGARDLHDADGRRIAQFFDRSGLEQVAERFERLGDADLDRQSWFLDASLMALATDLDNVEWPSYGLDPASLEAAALEAAASGTAASGTSVAKALRERALAGADAVAHRLRELAVPAGEGITWCGVTSTRGRGWHLAPLGLNLYSGLGGVCLFLAHHGAVGGGSAGDVMSRRLAERAAHTVQRVLDADPTLVDGVGGLGGWGGVALLWARLGALWNEPTLLDRADAVARRIPSHLHDRAAFDLLGGAAGAAVALLTVHATRPSDAAVEAAIACGDFLIERAVEIPVDGGAHDGEAIGLGWPADFDRDSGRCLGGLAHGASGMALAFGRLAAVTGEPRFRVAAERALAFEGSLYDAERRNWRDLRDLDKLYMAERRGEDTFICAWCHGAPGIGLTRQALLRAWGDTDPLAPTLHRDIERARSSTLERGFGQNHSLCHGDLGNLELFAGEPVHDPLADAVIDSIDQHGRLCGVPSGLETPSLFTGLAGVGYGLLRLADPERVPSILLLDP